MVGDGQSVLGTASFNREALHEVLTQLRGRKCNDNLIIIPPLQKLMVMTRSGGGGGCTLQGTSIWRQTCDGTVSSWSKKSATDSGNLINFLH